MFRKSREGLNVIQEVGRDPLRVHADTPPEQVIDVARKLKTARKLLETVLPQARKPFIVQNRTPDHDDWDDPLAVNVGLQVGADDIPAEGWPDTFKPDVVKRILGYLPTDDQP